MRALLGGIVGAVVSATAWLGIEHIQQTNYGWLVILVGLVTGVSVNKAGAGSSAGFARGALAMVLTLAGIVGGQKGYAKFMEATTSTEAVATAAAIEVGGDDEEADDEEADADSERTPAPPIETTPVDLGSRSYSKSAMKKNFGEWDMIWMCVAALAAYVTGKGGADKIVAEEQQDGEAPSSDEPSGDEAGESES
ncbi:MAG: hypothetical protein AAGD11_07180 [Planctomycetota bacterium]